MKKSLFILTLVATIILAIPSQSNAQVSFGLKGGYNNATIIGLSDILGSTETKPVHGFTAGGFSAVKLAFLSLQLEALYSQQGGQYTDIDGVVTYENNYLNIPVIGKINIGPLDVHAGVQYGLLLSSTINGIKDDSFFFFKKTDYSVPMGIGIDVSKIMIEARYILGLSNIDNTGLYEFRNNVLQLTLGVKL